MYIVHVLSYYYILHTSGVLTSKSFANHRQLNCVPSDAMYTTHCTNSAEYTDDVSESSLLTSDSSLRSCPLKKACNVASSGQSTRMSMVLARTVTGNGAVGAGRAFGFTPRVPGMASAPSVRANCGTSMSP